jgi:hypothetical protein
MGEISMKVIVAGSRNIVDQKIIFNIIESSNFEITEIVSGTARGVDQIGEKYGLTNNIPIVMFPANWNKYGKSAGYVRNTEMAKYADALIAVWDGKSSGTRHMIKIMHDMQKPVHVVIVE